MVLLLNMFRATSPATESLRVGRFFNHLSGSNDLHNLRGQSAMPKPDAAIPRQVHAMVSL